MSSDKKEKRDPFQYYKRLAKEWETRTQAIKVPKLWKLKTGETENGKAKTVHQTSD